MSFYRPIISFIKRKILRISRDRWNYQYGRGQWCGLHEEKSRFHAVISALHEKSHPLDILEIGCGDAILFRKLPDGIYKRFTGMDISDVAVAAAKQFESPNVRFMTGDMNTYVPDDQYDFIIFNESLYYAKEPLQVLKRFEQGLKPGSCFIITAVVNKYTAGFWPPILSAYQQMAERKVQEGEHYLDRSCHGRRLAI